MRTTASAPGKVAIIGEYAVLEGAPALVMAVNRRATVSLAGNGGTRCSVTAPGWSELPGCFELTAEGPQWRDDGDRVFPLAAHVLAAFFGRDGPVCPAFDLALDSTALMERGQDGPVKLGLGSSAALTVALHRALSYHAATQHGTVEAPGLDRLIEIHAGFQDSRGSGLDVAASLHGGLIEYHRWPSPRARPAALPAGVGYCFVWSGQQAATGAFLARIDAWRRSHPARYARAMSPLVDVAQAAARAAQSGDGGEFLRLLDDYVPALQALGNAAGTDILSVPHRRLREIAGRHGVVYKPCGAGGGDIGVGMSQDPEAVARFQSWLNAERFLPLSLDIDRDGVQAHSGN